MTKRILSFLLMILLLIPMLILPAYAAEGDPEFYYELTVDGKDTVEVNTGDIITVTLHLYRTDAQEPYTMYAMQDEIRYDSEFFELVADSALLSTGIQSTDIGLVDNHREFYMNYVSFSGGVQWEPKIRIGSFQLKVLGTSGVSTITNEDYLVSLKDGSGSYKCEANTLTVILATECTIKFETNGGTPIDPIQAIYGETIARPADPTREGKHLVGWYKDIHLTEEWNFETDTVTGNMTLYAKWADGDPVVEGDSCIICGKRPALVFGLCWLCLLILLLILLGIWLIILLWKRRFVKYSLVNGDIELNYRNGEYDVQMEVVLVDEDRKQSLNNRSLVKAKDCLRFIKNTMHHPVVEVKPGRYKGELIIHYESTVHIRKCYIQVLDKELEEK